MDQHSDVYRAVTRSLHNPEEPGTFLDVDLEEATPLLNVTPEYILQHIVENPNACSCAKTKIGNSFPTCLAAYQPKIKPKIGRISKIDYSTSVGIVQEQRACMVYNEKRDREAYIKGVIVGK